MVTQNSLDNNCQHPFRVGNFFNTTPTSAQVWQEIGSFDNTNPVSLVIGNTQGTSAVQSKTAVIFSGGNDTNGFAKIQGSGNVSAGTSGKLEIYTSSSSALGLVGTWTSSGLTFSASNTALNNYSEGTWTPTIAGASTAGTTSYSLQAGYYRRVGSLVIVLFQVAFSSATGTGDLNLKGLPFTNNAANDSAGGSYTGGIALRASTTAASWRGYSGQTYLDLVSYGNSVAAGNVQMVASGTLFGQASYLT